MRYLIWISQLRTVDLEVEAMSREEAERLARIQLNRSGRELGWLESATIMKVTPVEDPHKPQPPTGREPRKLFPVPQAADILGVGRTTLYALMKSGELKSVSVGRRRFVARDQLERFIASQQDSD